MRSWEQQFLSYMDSSQNALLSSIREKRALDDDLIAQLRKASEDFNQTISVDQLTEIR